MCLGLSDFTVQLISTCTPKYVYRYGIILGLNHPRGKRKLSLLSAYPLSLSQCVNQVVVNLSKMKIEASTN